MKHKLAYSPKNQKTSNNYMTAGGRSPGKSPLFESTRSPQDTAFRQTFDCTSTVPDFSNMRSVPQQTEFMRHTMNPRLAKRLGSMNWEQEKPNKIEDLLRQTMNHKSSTRYTQGIREDISKEIYMKPESSESTFHQVHALNGEARSVQFPESTRSMQDLGTISQKIDRNKKLIETLRKTVHHEPDFLKNVNHNKSPTFIDLEQKEKPFRKKDPPNFLTPQTTKDNPLIHLKSSPNIEQSRSAQRCQKPESSPKKKWHPQCIKSGPCLADFQQGKKLGEGKFGVVTLAKSKKTGGVFALKKVPKAMIKSHMMVDQLSLELRIQSCLNHKNILGMYGFFDDKTHLYIVLEYMDGGTLYELLKKNGKLSQKDTASIMRQVTSAIDYLHDIGIAHRDIKPENVVISNHVYKLCDFGWAAICDERRKTYCGTFDYVPPEILEGCQYDMTVDEWSLGVMTFELLTGKAPFYHISRKQTMKRILNANSEQIKFPESMSAQAKDFIEQLIQKDPNQRIKACDALKHPFLKVDHE